MTSKHRPGLTFTLIALLTATAALDATLQKFQKSQGLYYDHVGEAQLYNTEWKLLNYVDLQEADRNLETVINYAELSKEFCKKHENSFWVNFSDGVRIARYTNRKIREVQEMKDLVSQLTSVEDRTLYRSKRGLLILWVELVRYYLARWIVIMLHITPKRFQNWRGNN
jgi:hypothetical protein